MVNSVSFFHLADLHIGIRLSRFDEQIAKRIREARFQALDNALKVAQDKNVDFIIIAGDVFDDNSVSLVESQRLFDILKGKPMPVYVLPGNHDPYRPGSVWDRHPWSGFEGTSIYLLNRKAPVFFQDDVIIYPCPVTQKTSIVSPTEWIEQDDIKGNDIHIGVAHGSVMDRDTLPPDDHPILPDCAEVCRLDYLALGHWHSHKIFPDSSGIPRMAYPGTHEQMSFGPEAEFSVGWEAYASDPKIDEFLGASEGKALLVKITKDEGRSYVEIQEEKTGQLLWNNKSYEEVDDTQLNKIFSNLAQQSDTERRLLHISLKGVVSAESLIQIEAFEYMLERYLFFDLNTEGLHIKPAEEELRDVLGPGILRSVYSELETKKAEASSDEEIKVIETSMLSLYRLAKEVSQ